MKNGNALTPALYHPMGEGESSSAGRRTGRGWDFREAGFAVSSPVGRERVSPRYSSFDICQF
jgi:hypothetical protein